MKKEQKKSISTWIPGQHNLRSSHDQYFTFQCFLRWRNLLCRHCWLTRNNTSAASTWQWKGVAITAPAAISWEKQYEGHNRTRSDTSGAKGKLMTMSRVDWVDPRTAQRAGATGTFTWDIRHYGRWPGGLEQSLTASPVITQGFRTLWPLGPHIGIIAYMVSAGACCQPFIITTLSFWFKGDLSRIWFSCIYMTLCCLTLTCRLFRSLIHSWAVQVSCTRTLTRRLLALGFKPRHVWVWVKPPDR